MSTITPEAIARARQLALELTHGNEAEAEYHLALAVHIAEVLETADAASTAFLMASLGAQPVAMEGGFSAC